MSNIANNANRIRLILLIADIAIILVMLWLIVGMFSSVFGWPIEFKLGATKGLSSLLALAIGYVSAIRPWLVRPQLQLMPETKASYSPKDDPQTGGSWHLRLFVSNNGISAAKNCVGRLLEIRDSNGVPIKKFDPITLYWQRQDISSFKPVDIAGHGDYWVLDVAKIEKGEEISMNLRVVHDIVLAKYPDDHPSSPGNKPHLRDGTYELLIGIQADNAYATPKKFRIKNHHVAANDLNYGFEKVPCEIKQV